MAYIINGFVIFLLLLFFITLSIESITNEFSLRKIMFNNIVVNFKNSIRFFTRRFE